MLRSPTAVHPDWASEAFLRLGFLAEERGQHAAGLGLVTARTEHTGSGVTGEVTHLRDVTVGDCRVIKDLGRFSHVWQPELLSGLDGASIALGHTRRATQGGAHHLVNASPLFVTRLVGTHNGDIDVEPLRARYTLPAGVGGTDTEVMYQAIATYLALTNDGRPRIRIRRRFLATARMADRRLAHHVWRGFSRADRNRDQAQQCHGLAA